MSKLTNRLLSISYPSPSRVIWWLSACIFAMIFTLHFGVIIASNLPNSPLTYRFERLIRVYTSPYSSQRWTFFAPQPIQHSITLIARARARDAATGLETITPWEDISTPLIDDVRRSRLSPLALVQIGQSNALVDYVNMVGHDSRSTIADPKSTTGERVIKSPVSAQVDPRDLMVMTRTALSSLKIQHPDRPIQQIQVGVAIHDFPRFTKRMQQDDPTQASVILVDWQTAEDVPAFCCVR